MKLFVDSKNHLDIYLNENCNLRCSHCFVGNKLNNKRNMKWIDFLNIISSARESGASKLSLLGGEPTLYPHIIEAIKEGFKLGYKSIQLVTNGTKPLTNFLNNYSYPIKPLIVLSIDGIGEIHDDIRGENSFSELEENITLAQSLNYNLAGITSINTNNYHDIENIIAFCDKYKFSYLNVHRVNPLGFAYLSKSISAENWLKLKSRIVEATIGKNISINFDLNFVKKSTNEKIKKPCVVRDESGGNIMVYPDKKVFKCSLFTNQALNSYEFQNGQFEIIYNLQNEDTICQNHLSCPGSVHIGDNKYGIEYEKVCIYNKEEIKNGFIKK